MSHTGCICESLYGIIIINSISAFIQQTITENDIKDRNQVLSHKRDMRRRKTVSCLCGGYAALTLFFFMVYSLAPQEPEIYTEQHVTRYPKFRLITRKPPSSVNKAAHSGFETQSRRYKKSKIGVSVAPRKGPPKIKK